MKGKNQRGQNNAIHWKGAKGKSISEMINNRDEIKHTENQLAMSRDQPMRQQFFRDKLKRLKER